MKRIITLLAVLATSVAAHAQTDSLVVFDTQGDKLGISIAGFNISLGENADTGSAIDNFLFPAPSRRKVTTNFLGWGLGGMVLTPSPYYGPWEGQKDILDVYPSNSTRIDIGVVNWTIPLDRRGISYCRVGTMFSYDSYRLRDNITFENNPEGELMPIPLDGQLKQTRLKANYWGLNMGLGFKISKVMFMVQGTAELLTKSAVKYKNPRKTVYQINGVNPFRSRLSLSTNWEGYGFYIEYTLTPLFKPGTGNDTQALSIGCRFGL